MAKFGVLYSGKMQYADDEIKTNTTVQLAG